MNSILVTAGEALAKKMAERNARNGVTEYVVDENYNVSARFESGDALIDPTDQDIIKHVCTTTGMRPSFMTTKRVADVRKGYASYFARYILQNKSK